MESDGERPKMGEAKPLNVRIGINPISWTNDDLPSLGGETPLETALSEGAAIGYAGFELGNPVFRRHRDLFRQPLETKVTPDGENNR